MNRAPAFQFYAGDYLRDAKVLRVSLAARGLWVSMLCLMHMEGEPYGHLRLGTKDLTPKELARIVGERECTVNRLLLELETAQVFSRNEANTIFSRRMVRDENIRRKRAEGGIKSLENPMVPRPKPHEKGSGEGYPSGDPPSSPSPLSFGGSPSSSSSPSVFKKKEKIEHPASPVDLNGLQAGFQSFWTAFPKKRNKGDAEGAWLKLKPDEVLLGRILCKIEQAIRTPDWKKEDGAFIPYPANWLNAKGWEDEYPAPSQRKGGLVL